MPDPLYESQGFKDLFTSIGNVSRKKANQEALSILSQAKTIDEFEFALGRLKGKAAISDAANYVRSSLIDLAMQPQQNPLKVKADEAGWLKKIAELDNLPKKRAEEERKRKQQIKEDERWQVEQEQEDEDRRLKQKAAANKTKQINDMIGELDKVDPKERSAEDEKLLQGLIKKRREDVAREQNIDISKAEENAKTKPDYQADSKEIMKGIDPTGNRELFGPDDTVYGKKDFDELSRRLKIKYPTADQEELDEATRSYWIGEYDKESGHRYQGYAYPDWLEKKKKAKAKKADDTNPLSLEY